MQPNEQALQEYAAVADQYQAIHQLLEAPTPRYTVQMLARVGYLPSNVAAASLHLAVACRRSWPDQR